VKPTSVVVSCEHAGNKIPKAYQKYFAGAGAVVESHRGWDPGSKQIGLQIANTLEAPLFMTETTRLLVECNRSLDHPQLFSEYSRDLPLEEKNELLKKFYHPHRQAVFELITKLIEHSRVLHLSVHTFTPVLNGETRTTDIGLLFDDSRKPELEFCEAWAKKLKEASPNYQIDFNKPYLGIDDGFTTYLRGRFDEEDYLGIEIEVNQRWVDSEELENIAGSLTKCLVAAI
jgi:predicted N-formylglutamate amidohydrolase